MMIDYTVKHLVDKKATVEYDFYEIINITRATQYKKLVKKSPV